MALVWSLLAIAIVFLLGDTIRHLLRRIIPRKAFECATDFISSFQLSACVFEIGVIGNFYNKWISLLCSFLLLTLKNMEYVFDCAPANPCGLLENVVRKKTTVALLADFGTRSLVQLLGALLGYPFVQTLWRHTASEIHTQQLEKGLFSTLEVSLLFGFCVEVGATFIATMSDYLSRGSLRRLNPVIRSAVVILLCLGLNRTTGTWMNPALATAHVFAFSSSSEMLLEHLTVFWVGPMLGTLLAILVNTKFVEEPDPRTKRRGIIRKIRKSVEKNLFHTNGTLSAKRRKVQGGHK